ncbi:MAG: hydrogenase maturation protease [Actinobacteria bacterium]|nr:hydrogenase maturation protease [Actinomycetota bacterium]
MRVVIAGFGNVLRGDDGFGVAVAHALLNLPLPPEVTVMEIGIGGIHLVQELLSPADVLIIVDASDLNRAPGTVVVMEPEITDVVALALPERRDELADMHYATPDRTLILAGGLGIVPATTWFVGCQPLHSDDPEIGLSAPVRAAVAPAVEEVRRLVRDAGVRW